MNLTTLKPAHIQDPEVETKARALAALATTTAAGMTLFFVLALAYAPTAQAMVVIGGLLLVSLLALLFNRRGYVLPASWGFLLGYGGLIILSMLMNPSATSVAPYYLGVIVVLSGVLLGPLMPFAVATFSTVAIAVMVSLAPLPVPAGSTPAWLGPVLVPSFLLYLLATVAWLYGSGTQRMLTNLRAVAEQVRESVNVLGQSASDILAATTQVAAGTAETATAVGQTMTTVEEVRQASGLSTKKAKLVSERAQKAAEVAEAGHKAVDDTAEAMARIRQQMESIAQSIAHLSEQSQAIGEIIATVNDLAEQSNLLAVNAAIEAAKAGEQGKGFAVVAQEIKSLAEQSKQATAQVRAILGDIQRAMAAAVMATEQGNKTVESGVKQSADAGNSIRTLADSIAEAAQAATQIAASSQQQLVGMDQLASAMESISEVSVESVASTRQAEAAAQRLHELGQTLTRLVDTDNV